jgi:hypothetical protein
MYLQYKKSGLSLVRLLLGSFAFCIAAIFSGCDDDDENANKFVGKYVFTSATLSSNINGYPDYEEGDDITAIIAAGLFSSTPCSNPVNTAIELKSNKELFFICVGESNESKRGVWSTSNNDKDLALDLIIPASDPGDDDQALNLTVKDVTITGTILSGNITGLPIPSELFGGDSPFPVLVNIKITFTKIP